MMRNKLWERGITGLAAAAMCLSGMTVQAAEKDIYTEAGTFPIVTEPITLKIFAPQPAHLIDYNTNEFTAYLEELTGIDLEFETMPMDVAQEKMNLTMNSGDLPDAFLVTYSGAVPDETKFGIEEGSLIDLTDLIETKMPNVKKLLEDKDGLREKITALDGKIYNLPYFNEAYHMTMNHKMWVNTHLLEEMGAEVPKTTEEFYNLCKKYKEQYPDGIPVLGENDGTGDPTDFLINAFTYYPGDAAPHEMVVKDGVVSTVANTEGYREGLRYVRKLFEEGLIYEGAFTLDREQAKALIASEGEPVLFIPSYATVSLIDSANNPELYSHYYPSEPLTGPNGAQYSIYVPTGTTPTFAITSACQYPEAAARLVDYLYSFDGVMNAQWGVKGPETWGDAKEGDVGISGEPALCTVYRQYSLEPQNVNWQDCGINFWPSEYRLGQTTDPNVDLFSSEGLETLLYRATHDLYEPHKPKDIMTLPTDLKLTAEEAENIQTISVEVSNYCKQCKVQFITGAMDLDSDWDTYVEGLENMGMNELLDVYQVAYDRIYK